MNATATISGSKFGANEIACRFASHLLECLGMRAEAIITAMGGRLKHDQMELVRLEHELEELGPAYHKYVDTMEQIKAHEESIERLKAIIGYGAVPYGVADYTQPESTDDLENERENRALRRKLELWEATEQYLRFRPEARVKDILEFMRTVKIKASRQAIEAAINARPQIFKVRKNKREKFITLK